MEPIVLPDGSLSPRAGPEPDSNGDMADIMEAMREPSQSGEPGEASATVADTIDLPKTVPSKQDDGAQKVLEDVESLSPLADFDEAWGGI